MAERRAAKFEGALVDYLHFANRELTQRFVWACKPSLSRKLLIRFGTFVEDSVVDEHGRPRPIVTTVVNHAVAAAVAASSEDTRLQLQFSADPQINSLAIFLTNLVFPWLCVANSRLAGAATAMANGIRQDALIQAEKQISMEARQVTGASIDSGGAVTVYGRPQ